MLSRVITSWGGMSSAITRSDTFCTLVRRGGRNTRPGPLAPQERPRKKTTPRSYSRKTLSAAKAYSTTTPTAGSRNSFMATPLGGEGFDDHRGALTAADARRAQPVALPLLRERVQEMNGDAGAGRGEGMPDGDGAAVHVGPGAVQAQLLLDREVLRRERLVHFHQIHLVELQARLGERLARRGRGPDPHVLGLHADHRPGDEASQRLRTPGFRELLARDHRRRAAVADAGRVARGDEAVLLEV